MPYRRLEVVGRRANPGSSPKKDKCDCGNMKTVGRDRCIECAKSRLIDKPGHCLRRRMGSFEKAKRINPELGND